MSHHRKQRETSGYAIHINGHRVRRVFRGAYDGELYQNELSIRALQREFDSVSGELRSLYAVLGKAGEALTLDWIEAEERTLEAKRATLQAAIEEAERQTYVGSSDDQLTLKAQEQAYKEVQDLQEKLGDAKQQRDALS